MLSISEKEEIGYGYSHPGTLAYMNQTSERRVPREYGDAKIFLRVS